MEQIFDHLKPYFFNSVYWNINLGSYGILHVIFLEQQTNWQQEQNSLSQTCSLLNAYVPGQKGLYLHLKFQEHSYLYIKTLGVMSFACLVPMSTYFV